MKGSVSVQPETLLFWCAEYVVAGHVAYAHVVVGHVVYRAR